MKKLFSILLALALLAPCVAALAEDAPIILGYIAPVDAEGGRYSLCADAFSYAASQVQKERRTVLITLRYDPRAGELPEGADGEDRIDPAVAALMSLIEDGVNCVAVCPTSIQQAEMLIDLAQESGIPIVIEGLDVSSIYPPSAEASPSPEETPDPDAARPYVAAVGYGDAAAYTAAMWLEEFAYNPMLLHCTLPESDPAIQAGIERALADAAYLSLADDEISASADTADAGRYAIELFTSSGALFGCVLADSYALAEGCAKAVRQLEESCPIAAIASSQEALELLERGEIDMLAAAPASVEGVETFKVLWDFAAEGIIPETETGFVQLSVITATKGNTAAWIGDDDFEAAYAQAYPEALDADE